MVCPAKSWLARTHRTCSPHSFNNDDLRRSPPMATYYDLADLGKFGQIGTHGQELADKFFEWYGAATATDGALTKREKQLIGLAVAHTIQCPYCIDAYTQSCLESGADPTQMTEALHVAAAVRGGASL